MKDRKFLMSFWNYTPAGTLEEEEAAKDWKELGMTVAMSSFFPKNGDKELLLSQLDEAWKNGLRVIVCDERTLWANLSDDEEAFRKDVREAIADFGAHPAFYAFFIGDEPNRRELERAVRAARIVNESSEGLLNFLPMFDEPFVSDYGLTCKYDYEEVLVDAVRRAGLKAVAYDNYTQCYIHNKKYGLDLYFDNLQLYRSVVDRCGAELWTTLLSVGHWLYRIPTEDDIRWQISTAAAYGVKGLFWFFLYARELDSNYRNSPFDEFYKKTETYFALRRQINLFMEYYAEILASARLKKVYHFGTVYGRGIPYREGDIPSLEIRTEYGCNLLIGDFASPDGDFVMIVNNTQEADGSERVSGTLNGQSFTKWLAPGQIAVLRK